MNHFCRAVTLAILAVGIASCSKAPPPASPPAVPAKHEHHAPHGGTAVVLGDEAYHLELVRDGSAGTLTVYVLDGEMEEFQRIAQPTLELTVTVGGATRTVALAAVANPATGETVGSTSCFSGRADWLKTTAQFDATLAKIEIHGTTFASVAFNFPNGNDRD